MRRGAAAGAALVLVGGLVPLAPPLGGELAQPADSRAIPFDVDGDGYVDLAVTVPGEDVGEANDAGAVQVLYGSRSGPTARDQLWHQDRRGVKGAAEEGDCMGCAGVASGDFDADGYADLAIGIPGEDLGRNPPFRGPRLDVGAVQVLYGGPRRLTARDQFWHRDSAGVPGSDEEGDQFGRALAVGDFDGDGYDDLVIGVPYEDVGDVENAGSVVLLRGSAQGLSASGAQSWNQSSPGVVDNPERNDRFGSHLAVGDFNADGRDDLAVSIPLESGGNSQGSSTSGPGGGAVQILMGDADGLSAGEGQLLTTADMGATIYRYASWVLTTGDFDADGRDDLALGQYPYYEDVADNANPVVDFPGGSVGVLYAKGGGFDPAAVQWWHLDRADLPGTARVTDRFGLAVAAGDLTGDGVADLAIGAPGRTVAGHRDAGAVYLLTGGDAGLRATSTVLTQQTPGVPGWAENRDYFGSALTVAAGTAGSTPWLAIGTPGESIGSRGSAGALTIVPWSAAGPLTHQSWGWHQNSAGIKGHAEPGDAFGDGLG